MHVHHEAFLIHKEGILPTLAEVPVLVLDGNAEFETDQHVFQTHVAKIQDFMLQVAPPAVIDQKAIAL